MIFTARSGAVRTVLAVTVCAGLLSAAACDGKPTHAVASPTRSASAAPPPSAVWFRYDTGGSGGGEVRVARARLGARRAASEPGIKLTAVNYTFSPNTLMRTWTEAGSTGKGELWAAGDGARTPRGVVATDSQAAPCARPAWLDDRRIVYPALHLDAAGNSSGPQRLKAVQVRAGDGHVRYKRLKAIGATKYVCLLTASGDGGHLVGTDGQGGAGVIDVATGASRAIPGVGSFGHPPYAADIRGVSRDGGVVAVRLSRDGATPGDGTRQTFARPPTLLDTRTGAKVPIPVQGKLVDAQYLPGGGLLVRVAGKPADTLVLLVGGKEAGRWTEPAAMRTWGLLSVGP
jgi:hypothetical protein